MSEQSRFAARFDDSVLALIDNVTLRMQVIAYLTGLHAAFWPAPASFSGRYHAGETLVEHTLYVVRIARHLAHVHGLRRDQRDVLTAAALFHDSTKGSTTWDHTDPAHPKTAADAIRAFGGLCDDFEPIWQRIAWTVETHMSWWGTTPFRGLEEVRVENQILIEADYLASQTDVCAGPTDLGREPLSTPFGAAPGPPASPALSSPPCSEPGTPDTTMEAS